MGRNIGYKYRIIDELKAGHKNVIMIISALHEERNYGEKPEYTGRCTQVSAGDEKGTGLNGIRV